MWYVLRGWPPLRGMRRTAQARALRVSAGADALCCMGWTPILPTILCLSRLRRSSVLRLWLRPRGARAERGYPTSWAHLRDKSLRFGLRLRLEQAHRLAFGSSPSCRRGSNWGSRAPLGARAPPPASTGRLGSLSPCRAHSDAGTPVPLRAALGGCLQRRLRQDGCAYCFAIRTSFALSHADFCRRSLRVLAKIRHGSPYGVVCCARLRIAKIQMANLLD